MRLRPRQKPVIDPLNVTPLLDVVFQLLAFFMIASTVAARLQIPVQLPKSDSAKQQGSSNAIHLVLSSNGTVWLEQKELSTNELQSQMQTLAQENPDLSVTIQGDSRVNYQQIVSLMDLLRRAGVARLNLATSSK